jgi:RNase H-fold protein (predicted Holliday junction resolvase)
VVVQVLQLAPAPLMRTLLEMAEAEGADEIVVGLPLSAAGTESEQAKKCRKFAERLAAAAHSR